jgi:hypothetical protein
VFLKNSEIFLKKCQKNSKSVWIEAGELLTDIWFRNWQIFGVFKIFQWEVSKRTIKGQFGTN